MIKVFNWNLKLWAVVAVIIVVLAGTGIALANRAPADDTVTVVSRVNTEGSGIFGDDIGMVTINSEGIAVFHAEKWKGKIVATPGAASIQDVMIKEQVKLMGLDYVAYQEGAPVDPDKVTIWPCGVTSMEDNYNSNKINAGITWEPWFSKLTRSPSCNALCTTDQIEGYDNHACCMIDVNSKYLANNPENVIRFLAACVKAVDWMNNAKMQSPTSAAYVELVNIAAIHTGISDSVVLSNALQNVTYTHDLTNSEEYAALIRNMTGAGQIMVDIPNPEQFAAKHIDSSPLNTAKSLEPGSYDRTTIKVAYLNADIHQLVVRVAMEKGFFDQYGIDVELSGFAAGPAVINSLLSGETNIGFAGAPPTVIVTCNMSGGQ